ncbi:SIP domain-containing protein [Leucobacter sp. UT-8R-CII-1-4]|uniref:siderophore-interacting protein n=1 Tax=Leucobacter sp. UT-8R-CII-1-4 TaxID=3040075 RepID=UPI0024A9B308|nr:SIP domain-containing protein [Leucobacter sp. UT-8R-CII-1-4]MDI6022178.1 SIP domain-containing protein [Leucobacter sp. UT-8R-CII-1-4]
MNTIRSLIRELSAAAPISCVSVVTGIERIAPNYTRVTVSAQELLGYSPTLPADGIKICLAGRDGALERRAMSVTGRPTPASLSFDVLRHEGGIVAPWLTSLSLGDELQLHAVRRDFSIGERIDSHLIVADASALPAAASLLREIPQQHRIRAFLHAPSEEDAAALLIEHPGLELSLFTGEEAWTPERITREVASLSGGEGPQAWAGTQAWFAAEAATVAMLRRQWVAAGCSRDHLFAAAYWKRGKDSTARDAGLMRAFEDAMAREVDLSDPDVRSELELSVE